ncbi:hypothetical protein D9619_011473 [Psilocybe cf. subviscida]|uniref:Uncharacterized protein n=1 Tax=Psilocybe cf. subviscida TaxID=2480587 RepID=A0A8H5BSR6_9AGAR|nr:hypothetical protein D9619_011473 [Psilocybe cf. subviscida]
MADLSPTMTTNGTSTTAMNETSGKIRRVLVQPTDAWKRANMSGINAHGSWGLTSGTTEG